MNKFSFTTMLYRVDYLLDMLLNRAMNSGVEQIKYTLRDFEIEINFYDGSRLIAWNKNRYYAWLSCGSFFYPKQTGGGYNWNNERPTRATMARLYKIIKDHKKVAGKISYDDLRWLSDNKPNILKHKRILKSLIS